MAIIYFIHTFVFSQTGDSTIFADDFRMVKDGSYVNFSWGKETYTKLIGSFRQDCTIANQLYRMSGMSYILNLWIYKCASEVPNNIAIRAGIIFSEFLTGSRLKAQI